MRLFALRRKPAAEHGPVDLPRDEMAFRRQYEHLLIERRITTVFRPGDRLYPAWRGYAPGEVVTARVIERVGSDRKGIPPAFNETRIPIRIDDVRVGPVRALTADDFEGSSPDVRDEATLRRHLAAIYGKSLREFGDIVSRIRFSYVDPQLACAG